MDYKKIIKTPKAREIILNILRFVPNSVMLKLQYKIKTGRKLNLRQPVRYTEKLQWYKLYYKNPIMHQCVDKYQVRKYVESKGLGSILVELVAYYDDVKHVKWDELPKQFVMKTTNGGGGLNVVVCKDKENLNIDELKEKLKCKTFKSRSGGREWAYYGLKPGIIVEKLLTNYQNPQAGVNDYKFFCYSGEPKYIIVDVDRYIGHKRNFYDTNWNNLHIVSDCPAADREIEKPENFEEMLKIASKLSEDFPYARVDLYNIDGKIYFGEITFYPWSGYVQFEPDSYDYEFGKDFFLQKMKDCK